MKQYRYDAFISYRHNELDSYVAENLHKQLEAFRLPKSVAKKKKEGRTKIERVFRDKDELPLTSNLEDPIIQALKESEFLIVICSPRLRESLWCKREIETFISLHGREKVLAVLIEGEPDQSFPEALLYKEEKKELPDGTCEIVKVPAEPLAADVRGKDKHAVKKAMRTEILRLLAPIFSVSFDDLRQRHRERKMKRILAASLIGGLICLAFGSVSTVMALRIQDQKSQIEIQNEEIQNQNKSLLKSQAVNLAEDSERQLADGDRIGAIETAYQALTEYDGNKMIYTPEAELALTESMHVYDSDSYIKPSFQLETDGVIGFMVLSPDRTLVLANDASGCLTIWNVSDGSIVSQIKNVGSNYAEDNVAFIGNDRLAYLDGEGNIAITDIQSGALIQTINLDYVSCMCADKSGKYLAVADFYSLYVYKTDTFEEVYHYTPEDSNISQNLFIDEEGTRLVFQEKKEDNSFFIRILQIDTKTITEPLPVEDYYLDSVRFDTDEAYLMLNRDIIDLTHFETKVMAYKTDNGKKLWESIYKDQVGSEIYIPCVEDAQKLMLVASGQVFLINKYDGSDEGLLSLGSGLAGGAVYREKDIYIIFTRDGLFHNIFAETNMDYVFEGQFQCHSQNVMKFLISSENYLVLPYMDNHITVYDYMSGLELTDYNGGVPEWEDDYLVYDDAIEEAQRMNIKKASLARNLFYDEEKTTAFVVYSDNTMEIYNVSDCKLLGICDDINDNPQKWLGTDDLGHIYVGGLSYGYMFDTDYHLLAKIEGLEQVNKEDRTLILSDSHDNYYQSPIFTLEELLAKAESYVLR